MVPSLDNITHATHGLIYLITFEGLPHTNLSQVSPMKVFKYVAGITVRWPCPRKGHHSCRWCQGGWCGWSFQTRHDAHVSIWMFSSICVSIVQFWREGSVCWEAQVYSSQNFNTRRGIWSYVTVLGGMMAPLANWPHLSITRKRVPRWHCPDKVDRWTCLWRIFFSVLTEAGGSLHVGVPFHGFWTT